MGIEIPLDAHFLYLPISVRATVFVLVARYVFESSKVTCQVPEGLL